MRVLLSAFSCHPGCGSDPGVGWSAVQAVAREPEVWGAHLRRASKMKLADKVRFVGTLDHKGLAGEREWAQLAILPSQPGSFGLAVAEASASGLLVITYAAGSVPEVIDKGVTGWFVPPGDIEALAVAIAAAVHGPERTYSVGLAGRERMTRLFMGECCSYDTRGDEQCCEYLQWVIFEATQVAP